MITEAEVRRLAGRWGVDPMIVDLDYVLGCFLAAMYRQEAAGALRFKGGTCLRKCYYADYRFSEDLDFTSERRIPLRELERLLEAVAAALGDDWQIDFAVRPIRVEVVDDEYGKESYQARLYYRGPLRRGGDPRAVRLDVTTDEVLVFPAVRRPILHPYSDSGAISAVDVPCYDLLEMLAEKTRALAGQRRYAISRDLYDIAQLTSRQRVDLGRAARALPRKLAAKGLAVSVVDVDRVQRRQGDFRADWERNLVHLLPPEVAMQFDDAWDRTADFLAGVNKALTAQG
ncbi:MAG: nucleotidyl transferase AbiEii/AbiGii toxin family protein [Phycisphaerae bacterium]|nr:nucleotidyl transferase AbiEii/AbiGii toxin family protein [Phycisphaerae bacterium]